MEAGARYDEEIDTARRLTASAMAPGSLQRAAEIAAWLDEQRRRAGWTVSAVPFAKMSDWSFDPSTGNLGHRSGRFFSIEGLHVDARSDSPAGWSQPIINQPEVGILGIVVKQIDGILQCLMQSKVEPGNVNGYQLSPTVQATRSNYTRAHGGAEVPFLRVFTEPGHARVLVDVLQSEHGNRFYRKRNRNMVVQVPDDADLPSLPQFRWLTVGALLHLLRTDDAVNMDARTVVSCMPFVAPADDDPGQTALGLSLDERCATVHRISEIVSWLNSHKVRHEVPVDRVPLGTIAGWQRTDDEISHETGRYFRVRGFDVSAASREVSHWTQPLVEHCGEGVVAVLIKHIGGVPHLLMQARFEPGHIDVAEIAPTLQCQPMDYDGLPPQQRPAFLDYVSAATPGRVLVDTVQSEEGGRFYQARNRHLAIEVDESFPADEPAGFCWMTMGQLTALVRHSYYLNIEARSLLAALHGVWIGQR
jgi:oxidase EvaA